MARTAILAGGIYDMAFGHVIAMTNQNSAYPFSNLNLFDPQNPAKATTNSTTITIDVTGFGTGGPQFFALINHNLFGATVQLTNTGPGGGAVTNVPIPPRTVDGQCANAWVDLRGLLGWGHSAPLQQLFVVVTGASANVAIGAIMFPWQWATVRWQVGQNGPGVEWETEWPVSEEINYNYSSLRYQRGMRLRRAKGVLRRNPEVIKDTTQGAQSIKELILGARGQAFPFLFIPDTTVNDCWMALPEMSGLRYTQKTSGSKVVETELALRELSMGLPL